MWHKINYIFNRRQKRNLIILLILIVIGSVFELLGVSAILPLVSLVTNPRLVENTPWLRDVGDIFGLSSVNDYITVMAVILIFIYIIKNVYLIIMYDLQYRFTYNNQRRIAVRLMKSYMSQEYSFHLSKSSAELMRNINVDVQQFFVTVLNILQLITELLTCLVLVCFLAFQDFVTTMLIMLIISIFLCIFYIIFKNYSFKLGIKNREVSARLNRSMLQAFEGIKETKVFNKEGYFTQKYDSAYMEYSNVIRKQNLMGIIPKPIIESVSICGLLSVLAVRICIGGNAESFVPMLSVFAVSAFRMLPSFNRITSYMNSIQFNKASVDAVYSDLKEIEKLLEEYEKDQEDILEIQLKKQLMLSNVTFRYPGSDNPVLDNINLTIPYDSAVALIGASGAGKSTLADIIMGLLPPQSGSVQADAIDVYQHMHAWHKILGYIPQTIYLIDDTIANNIAYGDEMIDETSLWSAIREAQLVEFINQLPEGVNTIVGERGVRLSGGQRQRIGIARALYRNPSILILDEATSALDNDTEAAVMEAITNLQGKTTMLIIAHRLTTIRNCDFIYEVKDGNVCLRDKDEVIS